jgi:putative restriction endonuclease
MRSTPDVPNDATRFVIASTDPEWLAFLRSRDPREVNFWRPSGASTNVAPGTPWFYRLRGTQDIVGCGFFAAYSMMPLKMAWETFGEANGVATYNDFIAKISSLRREATSSITEIGCAALVDPMYFAAPVAYRRMYGPMASGDTRDPAGAEFWNTLAEAMSRSLASPGISPLTIPGGLGAPTLVRPRLGQSAFRTAVLAAYERRCAISGERTLPVLEAAHIRPFADLRQHDVQNGLLMRSDLHALFDAGLVTVDADLRFRVSRKIRELYENGRDYYALDGRVVRSPRLDRDRPLRENLEFHSSKVFQP